MRKPYIFLIAMLSIMATSVSNAEEIVATPAKKNAIIVKLGAMTLSETEQTLLGSRATFEENSTSVFDVEYARKFGNNFSYGGEILHYKNAYSIFTQGDVETFVGTANIKKYFDVATYFQPFIGAGIGFSVVDVTGPIEGGAAGFAASASIGAEIPFDYVGIHLEYRYVSSTADGETTDGRRTVDFNVGGSALLAGVAIHF